jgi:hypothetical protein
MVTRDMTSGPGFDVEATDDELALAHGGVAGRGGGVQAAGQQLPYRDPLMVVQDSRVARRVTQGRGSRVGLAQPS